MSADEKRKPFQGSCHCGGLVIAFAATLEPGETNPRACDCSFCQKHAAAYVSDPAGRLSISEHIADAKYFYRQGSNNADFLSCARCGVLLAVVYATDARMFAAINVRCLDAAAEFGKTIQTSPQRLDADQKIARWKQMWIPDIVLISKNSGPGGGK